MKNKLLILIACIILAISLTACGTSTDTADTTNKGADLVGKWQIKAMLNKSDNKPVSIDTMKENGLIDAGYEMILQIDEDLGCTIFNGTQSTGDNPVTLTDNGDGSFHYSTKEDGSGGFNIWVEENTIDVISGDVVMCYGAEGKNVDCYFQKMTSSDGSEAADTSVNDMVLEKGKTIPTEDYEFTLEKVDLTYEVLPSDTSGYYRSYTAESGNIYIDVYAKVKNLMQRDIRIDELYSCQATYDNKYNYTGFAAVDTGTSWDWAGSYSAATPLDTAKVHYLIECPKEVEQSDKPLSVAITLADGVTYTYVIR